MEDRTGERPAEHSTGRHAADWRLPLGLAAALVTVGAVGWVDYVTGPDVGLSLFYLVPIVACGWCLGWRPTAVVALAAGLAWMLADVAWHGKDSLLISGWNAFTRLAIFSIIGFLSNLLRRDRERQRGLNARLAELLERERALARTDALTGLPNLRSLRETLQGEIARSERTGRPLCLAYVDIDNFKSVNDGYGHSAGDRVLRRIAEAIRETIRAADVPARMGGDEFAILFWAIRRDAVEGVVGRLLDRIEALGREYPGSRLGASAGIAYFERAPQSPDEILRRADSAMYEAKSGGKGRLVVWSETAGAAPEPPLYIQRRLTSPERAGPAAATASGEPGLVPPQGESRRRA